MAESIQSSEAGNEEVTQLLDKEQYTITDVKNLIKHNLVTLKMKENKRNTKCWVVFGRLWLKPSVDAQEEIKLPFLYAPGCGKIIPQALKTNTTKTMNRHIDGRKIFEKCSICTKKIEESQFFGKG